MLSSVVALRYLGCSLHLHARSLTCHHGNCSFTCGGCCWQRLKHVCYQQHATWHSLASLSSPCHHPPCISNLSALLPSLRCSLRVATFPVSMLPLIPRCRLPCLAILPVLSPTLRRYLPCAIPLTAAALLVPPPFPQLCTILDRRTDLWSFLTWRHSHSTERLFWDIPQLCDGILGLSRLRQPVVVNIQHGRKLDSRQIKLTRDPSYCQYCHKNCYNIGYQIITKILCEFDSTYY